MKSKEEMIEVMARAIWEADFRKGVEYPELLTLASQSGYLNAKTSVEILTMQAEAALKALCGALPEGDNAWHAVDILHELKQWGK